MGTCLTQKIKTLIELTKNDKNVLWPMQKYYKDKYEKVVVV